MAHITEFTVRGLAGRDEPYHQKLDRHVNVFFGLNGSGKTSLLKLFHAAMENDVKSLRTVPFEAAEIKIFSLDQNQIYTYTYTKPQPSEPVKESSASVENAQNQVVDATAAALTQKWHIEPEKPKEIQGWIHRYLPIFRLYIPENVVRAAWLSSRVEQEAEEGLEESFTDLVNQLWSAYSADVFGTVQRAQARGLADILIALLTGEPKLDRNPSQIDSPEVYERVSKFLERQGSKAALGDIKAFRKSYESNAQLRSVISDINSVELQIQNAMSPRDKLQSLIEQMFSGNKHVAFTDSAITITGRKKEKIGLAHLSSGEKQLIRIFIEALMVGPSSLMIDEPEISMHVDWQRQLIAAIRRLNPGTQLIAATHSPEIMAEIPDANIFRL